jgi:hypothetical protein
MYFSASLGELAINNTTETNQTLPFNTNDDMGNLTLIIVQSDTSPGVTFGVSYILATSS